MSQHLRDQGQLALRVPKGFTIGIASARVHYNQHDSQRRLGQCNQRRMSVRRTTKLLACDVLDLRRRWQKKPPHLSARAFCREELARLSLIGPSVSANTIWEIVKGQTWLSAEYHP